MLHVVEMLRWGSEDDHHYIVGIFSSLPDAVKAGAVEKAWRGGKYEPRITSLDVDCKIDQEKLDHFNKEYL